MSTELQPVSMELQEKVLLSGDLSKLSTSERLSYYGNVCASLGLNPLTRPFEYIILNGKLTLYARKDCTEQLRKRDNITVAIVAREHIEGVYVVTAKATIYRDSDLGPIVLRSDESIGAVPIEGLKGEAKANAMMKAETKAKRRVTLSLSGLGMLDETEIDSIPTAQAQQETPALPAAPQPPEPCVPNYGPDAGKPFSQVSTEHLGDYLAGVERSIKDPKKANFLKKNEAMRDALKAEIERRMVSQDTPEPQDAGTAHQGIGESAKAHGTPPQASDRAPATYTKAQWDAIFTAVEADPDLTELKDMVKTDMGVETIAYSKTTPTLRSEFVAAYRKAAQANNLSERLAKAGL
jgi:hypothetical protein